MECENCGTRRDEADRFCRWCGLPLPALDPAAVAIVPLGQREIAPIRPGEAAKGAAALMVSLGLAAMRYEPTRQLILRGLTALVEGRDRRPSPVLEPRVIQIIEIHQTVVNQRIG